VSNTPHDRAPVTATPEVVAAFTTDVDGRINSWSRDAEELFGQCADGVIGRSLAILLPDESDAAAQAAGDEATRKWFQRLDGTRFEARHTAVRLSDATGVIGHAQLIAAIASVEQSADVSGAARRGAVDSDAPELNRQSSVSPRAERAELRYSEEARVRLLRRLVIAQEEERRRIARDLHDHLGQQLTSLRLKVEAVRNATADLPGVQSTLAQADAMLVQIDRDIDFLSWELRPAALDDVGLKAVLENYVREWSRHADVPARFHAEGVADERMAPEIEATLYRIAQEALNNVAKHAHARSVGVVLEQRAQTMSLVVEDDGVGFEPPLGSSKMIGLLGMRERATVVGGTLEIEPTAGGGTTVLARVPLHLTDIDASADAVEPSLSAPDFEAFSPRQSSSQLPIAGSSSRVHELQRAVAARDEFIATVAHELRNPIAPLMFQVRLSIDKAEQLERAGESVSADWARAQLRRIEQRLHRLLETLDRLLDVSRLFSGRIDLELDNVDLVESVRDVLESFEAELAVGRCKVKVKTPTTVVGWWDRLRLDQICRNLVSNAMRFGAGRPIDVTVEADEDVATLTVRDYGIGIPPIRQEVIFERFERGSEASRSGGFGIGLWVVRNVCAAMGGSISVESSVGVGSTFAVTLPRRPDRDQQREVRA
jgi:PAS domain S-box-containing protein